MRPPLAPMAAVALAATGCGAGADEPLPPACLEGPRAVLAALRAAPAPVALDDGTPLSACVSASARSTAQLQAVGLTLHTAAEELATRGDGLALGYLIGAARRGSQATAGVTLELVRRLESAARRLPDAARERLRAGLRAGEATG